MANLNKENIITVDVKNATVSTQGNMTFYITDERTCNIYCQLVVNASKSALITKYHSVDNAEDFTVTLRLIKPNNEPKELDFILLDKADAFFYIDLEEEYKDCIGTYKCELFVDTTVNGELERVTTSSFTYKVNGSIMNDLDEVIGGGPDYPLVKTMATRVYVDDSITNIPNTNLLNDFATVNYVDNAISQHEDKIIIQDFASKEYVNNRINGVEYDIEEAGYTTESYVDEEISKLNTNIGNILINSYVTESEMNTAINEAIYGSDLSKYATQSYVNEAINNKTSYYDMRYATISYVDTEVDEVFNFCASVRNILQNVMDEYADKNYVDTAIANAQLGGEEGGVDLSDYATKEYVHDYVSNNAGSVDLSDYVHKDTFSDRISECVTLTELLDMNYVTADYVHEYVSTNANPSSDISYDIMTNYVEQKLEAYDERLSNRGYITSETMYDYVNGRFQSHNEDIAERGYLTNESASETYATNDYVNNMLGNIETLLGEI